VIRGSAVDTFINAHQWVFWGPILIAWWVGYQAYEQPNPLPALRRNAREFRPVIVWLVVGGVLFVFADPIKSALDSVLPTDMQGLAEMLFGMFIMLSVLSWEIESEARKIREEIREELRDIRRALEEHGLKTQSDQVARLPL